MVEARSPTVSVVVTTHNRPAKLAATLTCLARQTAARNDYEVVIVDDGSDPAVGVSENANDPAVRLVRLEGVERSAARNAGAASARGNLLVFVDDDMIFDEHFVAAHTKAHQRWPGILAVGAVRLPPEKLSHPFVAFRQRLELTGLPSPDELMRSGFCTAQNMSISRERFLEIGGFDAAMISGEDQDLALRFSERGGFIVFIPEADAVHDDDALDIRGYCRRCEWGAENLIPFSRRHPGLAATVERERINGLIDWQGAPVRQNLRKILKYGVAAAPVMAILFVLAEFLERVDGAAAFRARIYRLLIGVHIFRGYRHGLKQKNHLQVPQALPAGRGGCQQRSRSQR